MNREQALILTVLGDFLHRRESAALEGEYDWSALFQYGVKHRLNGIVFYQLGDRIPEPFRSDFHAEYLSHIVRYRHRQEVVRQMEEILRSGGVEHFYLKGDLIGALYTNPMLRSVSDVDLMVPADRLADLHDRLTEAGFVRAKKGVTVWEYYKERLLFEIHTALINCKHREDAAIADYFSRCWDSVENGKLDWNVHMIYLFLHLRKHFRESGVGFRQFLDLAFVAQNIPLDWDYIHAELDRLGLWRFAMTAMNLCELWFGADCAPEKLELDADYVESFTETIFQNGIFGYANKENKENVLIITAQSDGVLGLLKRFLQALFPSYEELSDRGSFRFLRGRPWLLPLAWIWHIILFFAEGKALEMLRSFIRFRKLVESRNETYEKLGLTGSPPAEEDRSGG